MHIQIDILIRYVFYSSEWMEKEIMVQMQPGVGTAEAKVFRKFLETGRIFFRGTIHHLTIVTSGHRRPTDTQ